MPGLQLCAMFCASVVVICLPNTCSKAAIKLRCPTSSMSSGLLQSMVMSAPSSKRVTASSSALAAIFMMSSKSLDSSGTTGVTYARVPARICSACIPGSCTEMIAGHATCLSCSFLCAGVQNFQNFPACGSQGQGLLHSFSAHSGAVFPSGLESASFESLAFRVPFFASSCLKRQAPLSCAPQCPCFVQLKQSWGGRVEGALLLPS